MLLAIVLMPEDGDHLFQVHLVAEESHLDARQVSRHEPLSEGGFFVVPVRAFFLHSPERACKRDLLGRLSCSSERCPFAQLASFPPMCTARRRTCAATSGAERALELFGIATPCSSRACPRIPPLSEHSFAYGYLLRPLCHPVRRRVYTQFSDTQYLGGSPKLCPHPTRGDTNPKPNLDFRF